MVDNLRDRSPANGVVSGHTSRAANLLWVAILAIAALGGSIQLSCTVPFAALAVALAGTLRVRGALGVMAGMWLANQIIGFGLYDFPRTVNTILWGVAIGVAALLATLAASCVIRGLSFGTRPVRVGVALLAAFGLYEIALLTAAVFLGGMATFAPGIVAEIAVANGLWLGGLIVLNEIVAALCRSWLGATPTLSRVS